MTGRAPLLERWEQYRLDRQVSLLSHGALRSDEGGGQAVRTRHQLLRVDDPVDWRGRRSPEHRSRDAPRCPFADIGDARDVGKVAGSMISASRDRSVNVIRARVSRSGRSRTDTAVDATARWIESSSAITATAAAEPDGGTTGADFQCHGFDGAIGSDQRSGRRLTLGVDHGSRSEEGVERSGSHVGKTGGLDDDRRRRRLRPAARRRRSDSSLSSPPCPLPARRCWTARPEWWRSRAQSTNRRHRRLRRCTLR